MAGGQPTCAERPLRDASSTTGHRQRHARRRTVARHRQGEARRPRRALRPGHPARDDVVQAARPTDQANAGAPSESTKISRASWASTTSRDAPTPAGNTTSKLCPLLLHAFLVAGARTSFPPEAGRTRRNDQVHRRGLSGTSPTRSSPSASPSCTFARSLAPAMSVLPATMVTHPRTEAKAAAVVLGRRLSAN